MQSQKQQNDLCSFPRQTIQYPIILPFHTVHGVLKARILKCFAIPFSSGPHSVRPLHHDPPVLGCSAGMTWFHWVRQGCGPSVIRLTSVLWVWWLARRYFPETVLKQDALLLYNPKECRGRKSLYFPRPWEFQTPISSLRTPDPSLLWDSQTFYQPA